MNFSTGLVTCGICHDPHGQTGTKLLRKTADNDLICQQCHTGFYVENPDALLTHPIGYPTLVNPTPTTYADAYAADASNPKKFKDPGLVPNNAPQGITLINGYVSCSTCHAVHFADSDSATSDGRDNVAGLSAGDGHLLKADGPAKANKSVLCQTCHTYQRHGNPASLEEDVGCLVCHSGHSYNGGTPNYFVLRNTLTTVTFGAKTNALYTPLTDAFLMNKGNGAGFCERCHGLSSALPFHSLATGGTEERYLQNCKDCHKHNEAGFDFSWKWSGNSNLCGDCHGFPPYLNVEGDYKDTGADVGTKGGFAVMDGASDDSHSYATSGYSKSELVTPHKSHAGGGENFGAYTEATDYKFAEGQGACTATCHDLNSHKQTDNTASFRNIVWGPIAKGNIAPNAVNLSPVYTTTGNGSCGTVYCHSNGGTRPAGADRAKIAADFKFAPAAPVWGTGDADIIGATAPNHECAYFCHGNSATTMATGTPAQLTYRNNSVSHIKHLAKGYTCNVCHKLTADVGSNTVVLNTARVAPLGTHVNGKPDVGFDTSNDFDPGATGTQLNIIKPASGDNNSGYTAVTGVCNVYCHSDGKAIRTYANVDWDQASTGACGSCHQYYSGGVPTGSGAALSATHAKHFAIAVALTCNDCHGTNASTGTHTGHVDTLFTTVVGSCNTCHGIDGAETVPQWNASMSNDYCISCHTGGSTGNIKSVMTAPNKQHATDRGHNRTTAYPSGNAAGNKLCTSCHLTTITNHVNDNPGDATHLVAAATSCTATCHGVGGSTVGDNTKGIVSHFDRVCTNCHDPHGDTTLATNIYMIRSVSTGTGNYSGTVDFRVTTSTNSYDESDAANADDLCATCHTYSTGVDHNTKTNQGIAHHEGEDCFTALCHKSHQEAGGAFISGGGSGCNGCHGNPPATGAHRPTRGDRTLENDLTNPPRHSRTATHDETEDRTDCARCHTGADSYTFDPSLDRASAIAGRRNHGNTTAPYDRATVLAATVNYATSGNLTYCATACHLSSATDGYWFDKSVGSNKETWNKDAALSCNACHYYVAGATSSTNNTAAAPKDLKGSHNAHFAKTKPCTACHTVPSDTTHISIPLTGTDLQKIQNRAAAVQDEADVLGTLATANDPGNETCSGAGVGLGCHNTKTTPAWTTTGITCTNCHTPGAGAAADPTSGLHIGPITVSGQVHNNTLGTGCANCHTNLAAQATHFNTVFEGGNGQKTQMGLPVTPYTQTANDTGTCSGAGVAGCHSDLGNWARKWSITARDVSGTAMCANCHGTFSAGWNSGVIHNEYATRGSGHSNVGTLTYPCTDCHVIGASNSAYLFTLGSNDWQVVELGTTKHGDNKLQMNSNTTGFSDAGARVGCATATCHTVIDSTHDFQKSAIFTTANTKLVTLLGDVPPVTCYNCHGGDIIGTNQNNYWPDKANTFEGGGDLSEDNVGRHQIHMEKLALSVYSETIAQLLTNNGNGTSDFKQKALCDYCHAGASNHGNKVNLPAQVTTMYNLWLPKTADDATWNPASNGNCTNLNCHNGKATSATANFTWYGTGTQNCLLCHNDITDTTGGTTGATHFAHTGSAAIYGKDITCGSCHGGSPSWSPYAVATNTAGNKHIDGQFKVGTAANAAITFGYGGAYTDYDTGSVGDCSINLCHNNGKNAASYRNGGANYNWKTAFTGCAACHRTDFNLGSSHDPHMNAGFTSTFRSTVVDCTSCHDATSASSMAGKTAHMDGNVNIAGVTYTGNLAVNVAASYGTCSGSCHVDHLAVPKASPSWNRAPASGDNCTICHASPPADGRHGKHMAETDYVTGCGNCHTNANNTATAITSATHFNGTRNTAGTASVVYTAGDGTCTNSCHKVTDGRDWTSGGTSPVLFCTDCHQAGTIAAGKGALPVSGLHNMTANGVQPHNDTLGANGCKECHVTPGPTHLDNSFIADSSNNGINRFINRSGLVWADGATNSGTCFDNGASGAGSLDLAVAGCHRDNGVWKRLWSTNADFDSTANPDPGQLVCDVCHGQYQSLHVSSAGWREGSVHYRSGGSAAENKGVSHNRLTGAANACEDCHAYDSAGGANHQNGVLNFDGLANGNPDTFTLTTGTSGWYCATCHNAASAEVATDTASHTFPDSTAFLSRAYVLGISYPEGGCTGCHGNSGTGGFWPDSSTGHAANQGGQHPVHVEAIAKKLYATGSPSISQQNATCNYCHPGNTHGGADGVVPADVSRTDSVNDGSPDLELGTTMKKIIGAGADNAGYWRRTPGTCSNIACHASAPFTPTWYADSTAPGTIAILTASVPAGSEPGTATLNWTAPGDDGFLDGTAYIYDVRFRLSTDGTISEALWTDVNTKQAGNPPKVDRWGKSQSMIVKGLTPGAAYTFAVKTADERYPDPAAWSAISTQKPSATAQSDNVVPVFTGVSTLKAGDAGDLLIDWEAARDHSHGLTTPILYKVWYGNYSLKAHLANSGTLPAIAKTCYDKDTTPPTVVTCDTAAEDYHIGYATTTALKYQATTGLKYGNAYYAMVRARDVPVGNEEANTNEVMALAKAPAKLATTLGSYKANGANSLGAAYATPQTAIAWAPAAVYKWYRDTGYGADTNVSGISFEVYIADSNKNTGLQFSYQLGYGNGTTFTPLPGTAGTMTVGKASKRVRKIPLNGFSGMVPSGQRLCVQLTNTGGANMLISYGDNTNKGLLLVNEQQYNHKPTTANATVNTAVSGAPTPGVVNITWTAYSDSDSGQTLHYDLFGSTNSGTNYNYVIATGVCFNGTTYDPDCTPASGDETTTGMKWDTIGDGIYGNLNNVVRVRVAVGDGYKADDNSLLPHVTADSALFTVNNSTDLWPPALIGSSDNGPGPADDTDDDLKAETRPKQGSVNLTWKSVGNDGYNHGTRAAVYDIRYRLATDGTISDANWADAATKQAEGEPRPNFSGEMENFELLGLTPEATYTIAMKVGDEAGNYATGISNVVTNAVAGPKCGICHSTPPDETATAGKHANHGYTLNECGNCHGNDPVLGAQNFKTDHQDGEVRLGWKTINPKKGLQSGTRLYYTNDGLSTGTVIYDDNGINLSNPAGGGGFFNTGGDQVDNGRCFGFVSEGISGCHGPATPDWATATPALLCSACHGLSTRTTDDFYTGREYDANITAGVTQAIKDQIKASPRKDNRGQDTGRYVGAHSKHLNSSFRLSKGDNCRLCHKDNVHYDGVATVTYDLAVTGAASWDTDGDGGVHNPNGGGTCVGTSEVNCHGSNIPEWHSSATVACNQCHGFNGVNPSHIKDGGTDRACDYCHPAGHPQGTLQEPNALMIPNNVTVGINYRSGGIHLLKAIGGRTALNDATAINGEAEICWGCHEDQAPVISEWGTNTKSSTGSMVYNYGTLQSSKSRWSTATWESADQTRFAYKTSTIKSTHTANTAGSSTVTGSAFAMSETPDNDDLIRCSYCHDVHEMAKTENDTKMGTPYLRGTWKGNPYKEDGAPHSSITYTASNNYGAVPRGGSLYQQAGGYWIDQNSNNPTSGWTVADSAGLCTICHGSDINAMDQKTGENLWMGTNGHSNSAIGGTFTNAVNIFGNGVANRPTPAGAGGSVNVTGLVQSMGMQHIADLGTSIKAYGYRNTEYDPDPATTANPWLSPVISARYAYNAFDWGVTLEDGGLPEPMYHQFSCSKCHNPHASRLPKLMITNCLDVQHNTWDDNKSEQDWWTNAALTNVDRKTTGTTHMKSAYYASAQNCHRYTRPETSYTPANPGGWNKVTPW